jgi:hypothetical protein
LQAPTGCRAPTSTATRPPRRRAAAVCSVGRGHEDARSPATHQRACPHQVPAVMDDFDTKLALQQLVVGFGGVGGSICSSSYQRRAAKSRVTATPKYLTPVIWGTGGREFKSRRSDQLNQSLRSLNRPAEKRLRTAGGPVILIADRSAASTRSTTPLPRWPPPKRALRGA